MPSDLRCIELPMAQIALMGGNHVEVRIRPDVRIDVGGLLASMQARRELLDTSRGPLYFIALGELDWDPAALQTDFFGQDAESITALAVLVDSRSLTLVANMYFSLFPASFPTKVFNADAEARQWLTAQAL
jgi:hypothetical protein